jgi:hypothetical protein
VASIFFPERMMPKTEKPHVTRTPGPRPVPSAPIRADEAYSKAEFLRRVGWKSAALTAAKEKGLRVILAGGRSYVLGSDWISFLHQMAGK